MPRMAGEKSTSRTTTSRSKTGVAKRSVSRKAPTRAVPKPQRPDRKKLKFVLALLLAAVVVSGTSIAIGMSDSGRIDISNAIKDRAAELEESGDSAASAKVRNISAQENTQLNGGLVGRGNKVTEEQRKQGVVEKTPVLDENTETSSTTGSSEETEEVLEDENGETDDVNTEENATGDSDDTLDAAALSGEESVETESAVDDEV